MLLAVGRWHQHAHVLSDHRSFSMAEQALGCSIEGLNDAAVVDHDHRIGHGIEHRPQMRLAGAEIAGGLPIVDAGTVELLAEPGDADADRGEDGGFHELGPGQILHSAGENAGHKAESGGEQTGAQSTDTGGEQNGRDEEEEGAVPVQQGPEPKQEQKQDTDYRDSEPIMRRGRASRLKCSCRSCQLAGFRKWAHSRHLARLNCVMLGRKKTLG